GQYFPGVDLSAPANTAFDTTAERDALLDPLLDRMLGVGLATQPEPADVKTELNALIDRLTQCGAGCDSERTATTTKAVCSAVLGSAATLVQ
ncbi:MAG: LamG domain-containing protein, partial [Pseudomonadota bacterium]